jgi:hypothetical protein
MVPLVYSPRGSTIRRLGGFDFRIGHPCELKLARAF